MCAEFQYCIYIVLKDHFYVCIIFYHVFIALFGLLHLCLCMLVSLWCHRFLFLSRSHVSPLSIARLECLLLEFQSTLDLVTLLRHCAMMAMMLTRSLGTYMTYGLRRFRAGLAKGYNDVVTSMLLCDGGGTFPLGPQLGCLT